MVWLVRFVVLLVGALGAVGCTSERDQVWAELEPTQQRWYRSMWGGRMPAEQVAERHAEFECVWAAVDDAGGDPKQDFDCYVRRMDRFTACLERDASAPCPEEAEAVCALSSACVTASEGPCKVSR